MTDRTLQLYNSNRVYYSLERDISSSSESPLESMEVKANGEEEINGITETSDDTDDTSSTAATRIDNPDQRITEDVRYVYITKNHPCDMGDACISSISPSMLP